MEENVNVVKKEPKWTSRWVVVLIVIIVILVYALPILGFVLTLNENYMFTEFKVKDNITYVKDSAKIYDTTGFYNEDNKSYYVQGYLENISDVSYDVASVEYLVYDKDDALLGTVYASIDGLKKDGKWKFKTIYDDIDSSEVVRFELSMVELY